MRWACRAGVRIVVRLKRVLGLRLFEFLYLQRQLNLFLPALERLKIALRQASVGRRRLLYARLRIASLVVDAPARRLLRVVDCLPPNRLQLIIECLDLVHIREMGVLHH